MAKKGNIPWNKGRRISKECNWCGETFSVILARKEAKFCNRVCADFHYRSPFFRETMRKVALNNPYAYKDGSLPWNTGRKMTNHMKEILRKTHLGIKQSPETVEKRRIALQKAWDEGRMKGMTGKKTSIETRLKMSITHKAMKESHHLWKGGITPDNQKVRRSLEMRLWREAVFARDNYICQGCQKRGGDLHAHHVKPFSLFPELRLAIDNWATLCIPCHKEIHFPQLKSPNKEVSMVEELKDKLFSE